MKPDTKENVRIYIENAIKYVKMVRKEIPYESNDPIIGDMLIVECILDKYLKGAK